MLEADLRKWLRKVWGSPRGIMWIEPARGSSLGVPDVMLDVFGSEYWLPVELKVGKQTKEGVLKFKVRPAQKRYHRLAKEEGRRTAFMVLVEGNKEWLVFLVNGDQTNKMLIDYFEPLGHPKEYLMAIANSNSFWGK